MSVSINITAENAWAAQIQMAQLLEGRPQLFQRTGGVLAGAVVKAETLAPTIELAGAAPTDEAPAVEKAARKPRAKKSEAEAAPADVTPEDIAKAEAIVASEERKITRDDVKAMIKHLHQKQGETFIPRVLALMAPFGAKMQSEVKDADLPEFYAKLCEMDLADAQG